MLAERKTLVGFNPRGNLAIKQVTSILHKQPAVPNFHGNTNSKMWARAALWLTSTKFWYLLPSATGPICGFGRIQHLIDRIDDHLIGFKLFSEQWKTSRLVLYPAVAHSRRLIGRLVVRNPRRWQVVEGRSGVQE